MSEEYEFYKEDEAVAEIQEQAERHVDWLLNLVSPMIRKIAIAEYIHRYKHGKDSK